MVGLIVLIQGFAAVVALRRKTDKVIDIAYWVTFFVVIWRLYLFQSNQDIIPGVLVILLSLWSIRIATYLFLRILALGKDRRFEGIRANKHAFLRFRFLQSIVIFLLLLPVMRSMKITWTMAWYGWIGTGVVLLGISIETIADRQKFRFKREYPSRRCNVWLRSMARHPNYFGEILVRWWLYLICLSVLTDRQVRVGMVSPFAITWLLLFVTGIPPLKQRHEEKWGKNKERQLYKQNTNLLLPW